MAKALFLVLAAPVLATLAVGIALAESAAWLLWFLFVRGG